ncbi:MAG: PHP domain-containing protein [Clostridia bacterium]|nr:PHP domain-containing protein [Clostridia bacterium]
MRLEALCVADLHLHTNLSLCAPSTTTAESYLPYCEQEGIKRIGISNHLYLHLGLEYTLQSCEQIRALQNRTSVQLLFGCEMELHYGRPPMLDRQSASAFDYVLVAPSHIFNQIHHYRDFDLSTPEKVRHLTIENFKQACYLDLGVPTAICHPLYPICAPDQQEILDGMDDQMLGECYTLAARHEKSIEIHACLYRNTVTLDEEGLSPSYIRMLSIAKECGCRFHFGSDAHAPETFIGKHALLERAAQRAGIRWEDLWQPARV